jgi:hypothetical protein
MKRIAQQAIWWARPEGTASVSGAGPSRSEWWSNSSPAWAQSPHLLLDPQFPGLYLGPCPSCRIGVRFRSTCTLGVCYLDMKVLVNEASDWSLEWQSLCVLWRPGLLWSGSFPHPAEITRSRCKCCCFPTAVMAEPSRNKNSNVTLLM